MGFLMQTLKSYLDFQKWFEDQKKNLQNFICDLVSFYNITTHKLILEGKCLEFPAIKRISCFLLMFLHKELELLLILVQSFSQREIIPQGKQLQLLTQDLKNHQQNLISNIFAMISEGVLQQASKLEEQDWDSPSFRFLSPSVQSCNVINFVTEVLKEIDSFLSLAELQNIFDEVVKIVINCYIS